MERSAVAILSLAKNTEPDFVRLAGELKSLYQGALELTRNTHQHIGVIRTALEGTRLTGDDGLAGRALAELQHGIEQAGESLGGLSRLVSSLVRLRNLSGQLERIATLLMASGCNFAVESARTTSSQESFGAFVQELRQLAEKIRTLGEGIGNQSLLIEGELRRFDESIGGNLQQLRQLSQRSQGTVRQTCG